MKTKTWYSTVEHKEQLANRLGNTGILFTQVNKERMDPAYFRKANEAYTKRR